MRSIRQPAPSQAVGQLALHDLAGRVAGQLVEERHVARHLVARQLRLHVRPQVVGAHLGAGLERDVRRQPLAELLVVDADHRGLADRGVGVEGLLDLERVDVLAAGHDHLVVAADDVEPPGLVDPADVAGDHVVAEERLGVARGVALELEAAAHRDPADLALRHLAVGVVEDPQLGADDRLAGGVGRDPQVRRARRC